jgi:hypothetical protein
MQNKEECAWRRGARQTITREEEEEEEVHGGTENTVLRK